MKPRHLKCHMCNKFGRRGWQHGFCRRHALQRTCRPHLTMQTTGGKDDEKDPPLELKSNLFKEGKPRITSKKSLWQIMAEMDLKRRRLEEAAEELAQAEFQTKAEETRTHWRTLKEHGLSITETHWDEFTTSPEQQVIWD